MRRPNYPFRDRNAHIADCGQLSSHRKRIDVSIAAGWSETRPSNLGPEKS
jgi:hypothetical protein